MYLFESGIWTTRTESPEQRAQNEAHVRKAQGPSALRPQGVISREDEGREYGIRDRASDAPDDCRAIYEINDTYLELRGAWLEEMRGLITFLFLGMGVFLNGNMIYDMIFLQGKMLVTGMSPSGSPIGPVVYIFGPLFMAVIAGLNYFLFKYGWRWVRMELFTQRHILVRFNRKTRQVYLHRPRSAGGIVVLPWEATVPGIDLEGPDSAGAHQPLPLAFPSERTGAGYDEIAMVGPPLSGSREAEALWEYIRRYMEEGPQAVPSPRRLRPRFPWPWDSLHASLLALRPLWRCATPLNTGLILLLLSPVIALHTLCHWISMLLCWRPRWPREIAEAGQPGKPVPRLTVAEDFGEEIGAHLRHNSRADHERIAREIARRKRRQARRGQADAPPAAGA